jgi:hypothetical protein
VLQLGGVSFEVRVGDEPRIETLNLIVVVVVVLLLQTKRIYARIFVGVLPDLI